MQKDGPSAYDGSRQRAVAVFIDLERARLYSKAADIVEVIYGVATDGSDRLRYLAGQDAEAMATERLQLSDEAHTRWVTDAFRLNARAE